MMQIPLQQLPNQSLSILLSGMNYDLRICTVDSVTTIDVTRDNIVLGLGQRIVPGSLILPYAYQGLFGDFMLITANGDLPDYLQFGETQFLNYLSAEEIADILTTGTIS